MYLDRGRIGISAKIKFKDPTYGEHAVTVALPLRNTPTQNNTLLAALEDRLSRLPAKHLHVIERVQITAEKVTDSRGFPCYAGTAHDKGMAVSADAVLKGDGIVEHEFGHVLGNSLRGEHFWYPDDWAQIHSLDSERSVSPYARTSLSDDRSPLSEDFAETVTLYLQTDAGRLMPEARAAVPNKFKYLDGLMLP
jgi:hypothetical protein